MGEGVQAAMGWGGVGGQCVGDVFLQQTELLGGSVAMSVAGCSAGLSVGWWVGRLVRCTRQRSHIKRGGEGVVWGGWGGGAPDAGAP